MCGIAGYSIAPGFEVDPSALTKLLLAGLAERGEDASGFAWRTESGIEVVKHALPPHEFLAGIPVRLQRDTREAIVHVRDHTKGRPSHHGNNHPIRHGAICGVHNGIIQNDRELFGRFGRERALPGMSVDSEAIFMLFDALGRHAEAFEHLVGSYAVAFFDEREPAGLHGVRGKGRPLVLGEGDGIAIFASTEHALHFAVDRLGIEVETRVVDEGTLLTLEGGACRSQESFEVRAFEEKVTTEYSPLQPNAELARKLAHDDTSGARAS